MTVETKQTGVKFRSGLRTILTPYNLTFVILGDGVLVTTEEQAIYRQFKQRVSLDLSDAPAGTALAEFARDHAVNLVIDPRAKKEGGERITIQLDDVPFETAVRLMADMAGLKPVRMGNVLYVTTEARAEKLKDSDGLVPTPGLMPGLIAPGNGGFMPGVAPALPVPGVAPPTSSACHTASGECAHPERGAERGGEKVMVFAVQCPEPKCRKFMLVEDHDRGKVVPCLICKTPIRVAAGQQTQNQPPPSRSRPVL